MEENFNRVNVVEDAFKYYEVSYEQRSSSAPKAHNGGQSDRQNNLKTRVGLKPSLTESRIRIKGTLAEKPSSASKLSTFHHSASGSRVNTPMKSAIASADGWKILEMIKSSDEKAMESRQRNKSLMEAVKPLARFESAKQHVQETDNPIHKLRTHIRPSFSASAISPLLNPNNRKVKSSKSTSNLDTKSSLRRISSTGRFNYELGRTGFLSEAKMRARRFAQDPKKYLDMIANSNEELELAPTEIPELESFVENLSKNDRYESKQAEIWGKAKLAKDRGFLLSMASKSMLNDRPALNQFMNEFGQGKDPYAGGDVDQMGSLIEQYLAEIQNIDLDAIEDWILQFTDLNELELPVGLPANLKLPKTLENETKDTRKFIESIQDNFLILDIQYHYKTEEISNEMKKNFDAIQNGGWNTKDTSLLYYLISFTDSGSMCSVTQMLPLEVELTTRIFPKKSRREVIQQKYLLKSKKSLEVKRATMLQAWIRDKTEMETKANVAWQEITLRTVAEIEKKINLKKQKDVCEFWAERLDKMRKEKCREVRKIQALIEPIQKFQKELVKSITEKETNRRNELKTQISDYKARKSETLAEELKGKEIMAQMMADIAKKKFTYNKIRTTLRRDEWTEKEKARKEQAEELEKARKKQLEALERTKEPIDLEYNPENVVLDTQASYSRRIYTLQRPDKDEQAMSKFFNEAYSFSAETILKDRRVKFERKLREAGLLGSTYAISVLRAMNPKPKPHLESTIKLNHDD